MALITEADATSFFEPHHANLFEAVDTAWKAWNTTSLPQVPLFNAHTQATFIHDVVERELRTRLGGTPGVVMSKPKSHRFLIHFPESDIILRFKKLTQNGVSNYPTPSALAFNGQRRLDGVPTGSRVTLGYRLNAANDKLLGIYLALLKGNRTMWEYQLQRNSSGIVSIVAPPPSLPTLGIELKLKSTAKVDRKAK